MLKRQEEDREESHRPISSSSRRESYLSENDRRRRRNNNNAKAIGCMAGVFRLLSKYQTRGRERSRFLISGKKEGKNNDHEAPSSAGKAPKPTATKQPSPSEIVTATGDQKNEEGRDETCRFRRFSCKAPRSPTLPAEIRRSNSLNSPESFGGSTPPALVAQIMGSEEIPPAEKRRKLLGALEKCEEDLRAIKKMIEAHLSAAVGDPPPPPAVNDSSKEYDGVSSSNSRSGGTDAFKTVKKASPTPVPVLDHYHGQMVVQQKQQKPKPRKNPREEDNIINACLLHRAAATTTTTAVVESSPLWGKKGKIESVEEVCRDIAWGEKREVERIGFVLQDYICKDLIEEAVKELLGASNCCIYSLPLEACKRKLPF